MNVAMPLWTQHSVTRMALYALALSYVLPWFAVPNKCGNCWVGQNILLLLSSFGLCIAGMVMFERGMPRVSWRWRTPLRWIWYLVATPWLLLNSSMFLFLS
jgi:hypothetical protein